jgi:hypothetical protein
MTIDFNCTSSNSQGNPTMKTVISAVTLSLLSALSFAKAADINASNYSRNEAGVELFHPTKSHLTRDAVKAELRKAPPASAYIEGGSQDWSHATLASTRSREQVRAEAAASASRGDYYAQLSMNGGAN